jgi:DNA-binding beta-propeller fold protein YncE
VFSGIEQNSRDLFLLDLATKATRNITNDDAYDRGPVFSPDGKSIYYEKILNGNSKIVRVDLADLSKTQQITWGEGNDQDPALSPDGKRIYFTSSRNGGIFNIFSQDLTTGDLVQYTDVIGAALGPAAYLGPDGQEKVVYSGFEGGRFQLYVSDAKKPLKRLDEKALPAAAITKDSIQPFSPALEVAIDPEKSTRPKFKMFLENASAQAGINTTRRLSAGAPRLLDLLGNKRGIFVFDPVSTFSNFQLSYFNLKNRSSSASRPTTRGSSITATTNSREDGAHARYGISASAIYPLTRFTRVGFEVGFLSRKLDVPLAAFDASGNPVVTYDAREDNVPTADLFSYDATRYKLRRSQRSARGSRPPLSPQPEGLRNALARRDARGPQVRPASRRTLLAFRVRRLRRGRPELLLLLRLGHAQRLRQPHVRGHPRVLRERRAALPARGHRRDAAPRHPGRPRARLPGRRRIVAREPAVRVLARLPAAGRARFLRRRVHGLLPGPPDQRRFRTAVGRQDQPHGHPVDVLHRLRVLARRTR